MTTLSSITHNELNDESWESSVRRLARSITKSVSHASGNIFQTLWYQGVENERYPKPVKLGPRISAWREDEVEDVIRNPR
jgi:predicted DNA-binding transcriptional regulator AlpA